MKRVLAAIAAPLFLAGAVLTHAAAAALPPSPARWVTDEPGFLSEEARRSLDLRLESYQRETGHHILVWIGRTTGALPLEDFSDRAFRSWRVGRQGIDDGLVLFIFSEDRKARIEVGYGLEGLVPDAVASRLLQEVVLPKIAAGDQDGAVRDGVDGLIAAIEGSGAGITPPERRPPPDTSARPVRTRPIPLGQKILFGLMALAFLALLVTHPTLALHLLFSILSGGRGGGGGGSGGYSGGGGRSGGGGASGSW